MAKAQTFKLVLEGKSKVTAEELLEVLKKHWGVAGLDLTSVAVVNWDTKEAEGFYEI